MRIKMNLEINPKEISECVAEWNSVDEIANFVTDCIPDDEVAEVVVEKLKKRYPSAAWWRED